MEGDASVETAPLDYDAMMRENGAEDDVTNLFAGLQLPVPPTRGAAGLADTTDAPRPYEDGVIPQRGLLRIVDALGSV